MSDRPPYQIVQIAVPPELDDPEMILMYGLDMLLRSEHARDADPRGRTRAVEWLYNRNRAGRYNRIP